MPYGEESAYAAQAALKKKSPAYKKSSGFKMKAGSSPMKYFWEKKNVREARKAGRIEKRQGVLEAKKENL